MSLRRPPGRPKGSKDRKPRKRKTRPDSDEGESGEDEDRSDAINSSIIEKASLAARSHAASQAAIYETQSQTLGGHRPSPGVGHDRWSHGGTGWWSAEAGAAAADPRLPALPVPVARQAPVAPHLPPGSSWPLSWGDAAFPSQHSITPAAGGHSSSHIWSGAAPLQLAPGWGLGGPLLVGPRQPAGAGFGAAGGGHVALGMGGGGGGGSGGGGSSLLSMAQISAHVLMQQQHLQQQHLQQHWVHQQQQLLWPASPAPPAPPGQPGMGSAAQPGPSAPAAAPGRSAGAGWAFGWPQAEGPGMGGRPK